jgi:hypothetical protein
MGFGRRVLSSKPLFLYSPGKRKRGKPRKPQFRTDRNPGEIRQEYIPNAGPDWYRYTNLVYSSAMEGGMITSLKTEKKLCDL